jgi:hypothetical protein
MHAIKVDASDVPEMTAVADIRERWSEAPRRNLASWKWWAKLRPNSGAYAWKPPVPRWNLPTDSFTVSNGSIHLQPGAQLWLTGKGICFENVKFTGIAGRLLRHMAHQMCWWMQVIVLEWTNLE